MPRLFAFIQSRGPAYDHARPLERQVDWAAHAAFMDALVEERFVLLGGPLEGSSDVLLILRANDPDEITRRLAADPWRRKGLLVDKECRPWQLRLGTLP